MNAARCHNSRPKFMLQATSCSVQTALIYSKKVNKNFADFVIEMYKFRVM